MKKDKRVAVYMGRARILASLEDCRDAQKSVLESMDTARHELTHEGLRMADAIISAFIKEHLI